MLLEVVSCEERGGQSVVIYVDDEDSYELIEHLTSLSLEGAAGLVAAVPRDVDVVHLRLVLLDVAGLLGLVRALLVAAGIPRDAHVVLELHVPLDHGQRLGLVVAQVARKHARLIGARHARRRAGRVLVVAELGQIGPRGECKLGAFYNGFVVAVAHGFCVCICETPRAHTASRAVLTKVHALFASS